MKIKFKKQAYQTRAVQAVADCLAGQPRCTGTQYRRQPGPAFADDQQACPEWDKPSGLGNADIALSHGQVLGNIQSVQRRQNLPLSSSLSSTHVCPVNLDIEMETGTGKTYCYIKTMFELDRRYGWKKFVVVVPSIAIREGVYKSLEITADHFLDDYGKRVRFFTYSSNDPHELECFSSDSGINVMIINIQAFNATGKDARRIYEELDDFQSRTPIDVIRSNKPILILDEPQKMEGKKTVESLGQFNPLMILRYSATHRTEYNKIHRLDAVDAYNQKLVKKIAVRGISVIEPGGTNAYLYLESIDISTNKSPVACMEIEIKRISGIQRVRRKLRLNDNLFELSGGLDQYKGFVVADVDALKDTVSFTNGKELRGGTAMGDVSELAVRRIQIREAIRAHLEKEQTLFAHGIKVLTLFFIDEVAKYRRYDDGGEQPGAYARIFEEEYRRQRDDSLGRFGDAYDRYLKGIDVAKTHNGYFSIDKRTRRLVDPPVRSRGELAGESDDVDAYDLILKDRERLLSLDEPVRFIFSHSALREGWDNPNVFVICTLKQSDSTVSRRQEVGRGMRLSVNQSGDRMDDPATVHQINVLTVVASESYQEFVSALQRDIGRSHAARSRAAGPECFTDKLRKAAQGSVTLTPQLAKQMSDYLAQNDYIDDLGNFTSAYHVARQEEQLVPLPPNLVPHAEEFYQLIDGLPSGPRLPEIEDDRQAQTRRRGTNSATKESQSLQSQIRRVAAGTVHFDSSQLVEQCVSRIDKDLHVNLLRFSIQEGTQVSKTSYESLQKGEAFDSSGTSTELLAASNHAVVTYDLIGKIVEETHLTRNTIASILQGLSAAAFSQYRSNPEEFIRMTARLINEEKAVLCMESFGTPLRGYCREAY